MMKLKQSEQLTEQARREANQSWVAVVLAGIMFATWRLNRRLGNVIIPPADAWLSDVVLAVGGILVLLAVYGLTKTSRLDDRAMGYRKRRRKAGEKR